MKSTNNSLRFLKQRNLHLLAIAQAAIALILLLSSTSLPAQNDAALATVVSVEGTVWLIRGDTQIELGNDNQLFAADSIRTGIDGKASILLTDETVIRLHYNSEFSLTSSAETAGWLTRFNDSIKSQYKLLKGELWFRNKRRAADIEISTDHAAISVRGTEFTVIAEYERTLVNMLEGVVVARNDLGSVNAIAGEQVIAEAGKAPYKQILLNPEEAVQWTIKLPPIFSTDGDMGQQAPEGSDRGKLFTSWKLLEAGRVIQSLELLKQIETVQDRDISTYWQLYSLAALAGNNSQTAEKAARKAIDIDSGNPNSWLLLSYALQSRYELALAQEAGARSTQSDSQYTLGWLQQSRLSLGRAFYEDALDFALRAEATLSATSAGITNPDVQAALGFSYLALQQNEEARAAFYKVSESDQQSSDLVMGKALLAMRDGDSKSALRYISIATALEPANANYANYFARMLYEERRFTQANDVLERARVLDPNDPTTYYLQAIIARDQNREGEAIRLLGDATRLNDRQAVNRSRYLLDKDLAAKAVDQSLAFQRFGFNRWAERKAINAIYDDADSYSAQLMYAGANLDQPGRETVFASAALQARIQQPASANALSTFGSYTSLLDRSDLGIQVIQRIGSFDQQTSEATIYGVNAGKNTAFQLNYQNSESDGWRGVEDESVESFAALLKWDASTRHQFFMGLRRQTIDQSDQLLGRFEFDAISIPEEVRDIENRQVELAHTARLGPHKKITNYLSYFENKFFEDDVLLRPLGANFVRTSKLIDLESQAGLLQSQLDLNFEKRRFSAGVLVYHEEFDRLDINSQEVSILDQDLNVVNTLINTDASFLDVDNRVRTQQGTAYLIYRSVLTSRLSTDIGLYLDYFGNSEPLTDDEFSETDLNPRIGIVFNPSPGHAIRIAAYRYLFSLIPGRIDPVEVAGLSLYRGALPGTRAEEANLAYEADWTSGFFQILGYYNETSSEGRLQRITLTNELFSEPITFSLRRHGAEFYASQLIGPVLGVDVEAQHYNILDDRLPDTSREETLGGLKASLVHSTGLTFSVEQVYRHLRFDNRPSDDEFTLTNLDLEYEFPARVGSLLLEVNNLEDKGFNWVTDGFVIDGRVPRREYRATLTLDL